MDSTSSFRRRPWLLWDVLEEHLDEAAFFWGQRALALRSPDYVLSELEEGEEGRLRAHLDGLSLGGEPVARRLLAPALASDEPQRVAAAAWALLARREEDGLRTVRARLTEAPESRTGLLRALELGERQDLDARLLSLCQSVEPELRAPLLEVLAFRRVDASAALAQFPPQTDAPDLLVAALRAARASPRAVAEPWLHLGLRDSRPEVRNAAIEVGLIHGSREAWAVCHRCVRTSAPKSRPALLALAMGGSVADLQRLIERVSDQALRSEALWALGFSGRQAAAEAALSAAQLHREPLAALAFAFITGLPLEGVLEAAAPESEASGEAGEEVVPEPLAARCVLPAPPRLGPVRPRVDRMMAWWDQQRERFDSTRRYWHGSPWTVEALLASLHEAPLSVRPMLAWELAIRSHGACRLEPESWGRQQRHQLRAASKLRVEPMTRTFEGWMTS